MKESLENKTYLNAPDIARAVARAVEMESDAQSSPADPDLIAVIASWATLPATIKIGIMAMVGATKSHALNTCVNTYVNKNSCA